MQNRIKTFIAKQEKQWYWDVRLVSAVRLVSGGERSCLVVSLSRLSRLEVRVVPMKHKQTVIERNQSKI